LHAVRAPSLFDALNNELNFFDAKNSSFISIISVGEIYSLALRRGWGGKKLKHLRNQLDILTSLTIAKRNVINLYAEIDAFSQGKLEKRTLPKGMSARNMGKNDLWIAATASVIEATLVTTDNDFSHLQNEFISLISVQASK
ncbi:MAG: type II toxin-antitoxin system VapC family toxin, partial [Bacteroidota bacterium]